MKSPAQRPTGQKSPKLTQRSGNGKQSACTPFMNVHEHLSEGQAEVQAGVNMPPAYNVQMAAAFAGLFEPYRYKVFYGGRGGAKSWSFADALLTIALQKKVRVLCARELQVSISDSVYRLLVDRIAARKLETLFSWTNTSITSATGSEFLFKGLRHNVQEIKSLEGVDIAWVEEAQRVSRESWELLIPTIRKEHSEIWLSFNPKTPHDETWQRFVLDAPPDTLLKKVTWRDNPWFSETLNAERLYCKSRSEEDYNHIWEGEPRVLTNALVFKNRFAVEAFDTPDSIRLFYGADWGFAKDPTTLVRGFVRDDELCIDHEAWAQGLELETIHQLFDTVPGARRWCIVADSSRPEIIRSVQRRGFIVKPGKKWPGSVADGIDILKGFRRIVIHPRCVQTVKEFQTYSYRTDPLTDEILPILEDANNHCIDAIRYGFERVILGKVKRDKK